MTAVKGVRDLDSEAEQLRGFRRKDNFHKMSQESEPNSKHQNLIHGEGRVSLRQQKGKFNCAANLKSGMRAEPDTQRKEYREMVRFTARQAPAWLLRLS